MSGQFSLASVSTNIIKRPGLAPLAVQLDLDSTNGLMAGAVSDGIWTADLLAGMNPYSRTNRASAGKYTLLIPGGTNAAGAPGGDSFGALTVTDLGNVAFNGSLADGTSASFTSVVCGGGEWPFYISLYGGKGSILGWLTFTNGAIIGQLSWFKLPQAAAKFYSGGFTNISAAAGSVYHYTNGDPVLNITNGLLTLTNGNLAEALANQIVLGAHNEATNANGDVLTFKTTSGLFTGKALDLNTGKPITISGVVLQNQNAAAGYFLGTTESGSAVVVAAP